ncbi:MAG: hypothetical protein ACREQJ_03060 [Candidatus Binatia bacterium]
MSTEAIQATALTAPVVGEQTATRPAEGITALAERVERLEAENRQIRREALLLAAITTIAAGTLAVLLATDRGPTTSIPAYTQAPRRIAAEAFVLTDAQGQPRAELKFVPIPAETEKRARRR